MAGADEVDPACEAESEDLMDSFSIKLGECVFPSE